MNENNRKKIRLNITPLSINIVPFRIFCDDKEEYADIQLP